MARRDEVVPEDFLFHLLRALKPLANETYPHQVAIARMLWESIGRARAHAKHAGYLSFTHGELDESFGRRKFAEVNARLRLFDETANWSHKDKLTKGYRLTAEAAVAIARYMVKRYEGTTRLLYGDGAELKTLLPAIASKSMAGVTTRAWNRAVRLNKVPVDIEALESLRTWLSGRKKACAAGRNLVGELFFSGLVDPERIDRALHETATIIRMAKTKTAGMGYVMHHYVQASSGRLYAKGVSLQTTPRLIRQAALAGLWDFDFANCHYSILYQMAVPYGCRCEAIEGYLANKNVVRDAIASEAGITKDQAKVCLLAILYGARQLIWPANAIPKAIGEEAAKRLFSIKLFADIHKDIQKARKVILDGHPRTRTGWLKNMFGLSIGGRASKEKLLAHLIQGVEATALKAVLDAYPEDIVLVQHDGFTATSLLDAKAIEDTVLAATGYRLSLTVERIQIDPDAFLAKPKIPKRSVAESLI